MCYPSTRGNLTWISGLFLIFFVCVDEVTHETTSFVMHEKFGYSHGWLILYSYTHNLHSHTYSQINTLIQSLLLTRANAGIHTMITVLTQTYTHTNLTCTKYIQPLSMSLPPPPSPPPTPTHTRPTFSINCDIMLTRLQLKKNHYLESNWILSFVIP